MIPLEFCESLHRLEVRIQRSAALAHFFMPQPLLNVRFGRIPLDIQALYGAVLRKVFADGLKNRDNFLVHPVLTQGLRVLDMRVAALDPRMVGVRLDHRMQRLEPLE